MGSQNKYEDRENEGRRPVQRINFPSLSASRAKLHRHLARGRPNGQCPFGFAEGDTIHVSRFEKENFLRFSGRADEVAIVGPRAAPLSELFLTPKEEHGLGSDLSHFVKLTDGMFLSLHPISTPGIWIRPVIA